MQITLDKVEKGQQVLLKEMKLGSMQMQRLICLGFTPGAIIEITQNYGKGPLMLIIRSTCLALGRGVAKKIWVEIKNTP